MDKKIDYYVQVLTSERWHRLYVPRKEEGRGLTSIEDCVDTSIKGPEDYIRKSKGWQIPAARNRIGKLRPDKKKNQQKPRNRNRKKNKWMEISNEKLTELQTRKFRPGSEKETMREKLNLF